MTPRLQLILLGGAVLALLVVAYFVQAPPAQPPAPDPVEAAAPVEPTAENVAPSFHSQLMTLRQRVAESPEDTTHLIRLARLQQDGHRLEEAAASYERLLELAPDHRQAHLDLALVYGELGRWDDARRVTEALLARDADDPAGLYNLGAIAANQGDYDQARTVWTRVQAQTRDAGLARRAASSLQQLDVLAARGGPTPSASAPPATSGNLAPVRQRMNGRGGQALPSGHPPVSGSSFQPVLARQ